MRQGVVLPVKGMPDLHYLDPYPSAQPAVVLLHGLGADSSSWILQFEPLIDAGFRPIAPDISGFGASPYDGTGWSVSQAAKSIADLLAQLNAVPTYVVGLSMGGVIAQQMALDFPRLARRLVLVSTFSYLRPDSLRGWLYFARRAILALTRGVPAQARMVAWELFPDPAQEPVREIIIEQICRSDPRVYRTAMRALGSHPGRDGPARHDCLASKPGEVGPPHSRCRAGHHPWRGSRCDSRSSRCIQPGVAGFPPALVRIRLSLRKVYSRARRASTVLTGILQTKPSQT